MNFSNSATNSLPKSEAYFLAHLQSLTHTLSQTPHTHTLVLTQEGMFGFDEQSKR